MQDLRQAVQRVFGHAPNLVVDAVSDDQNNRTWLVEYSDVRCIAKLPEHKGGLTVGAALEFELLRRAAAAGVAPQPLGHDVPTEIVFIELLEDSAALSEHQSREPDMIARVGESLRTLHALPVPAALRRFDPIVFAEAYCADVRGSTVRRARALRVECATLATQYGHVFAGAVVCHNDLHAGNVLIGERLWLIDFEYAVRAAPIVDIASYAAYNELDVAAATALARACLGEALPFSAAELQAVIRIHHILGELWEIARSDNNAAS